MEIDCEWNDRAIFFINFLLFSSILIYFFFKTDSISLIYFFISQIERFEEDDLQAFKNLDA